MTFRTILLMTTSNFWASSSTPSITSFNAQYTNLLSFCLSFIYLSSWNSIIFLTYSQTWWYVRPCGSCIFHLHPSQSPLTQHQTSKPRMIKDDTEYYKHFFCTSGLWKNWSDVSFLATIWIASPKSAVIVAMFTRSCVGAKCSILVALRNQYDRVCSP